MTEILNVTTDDDGDITQFLIMEDGRPTTKLGTPENLLLYDPDDELPFDGGMNSFLSGESALQIQEEPRLVVAQAGDEYSYIINLRGTTVETTPSQAERVLQGIYDAIADDDSSRIESLHQHIMSNQVRRQVVNALKRTFTESGRIEIVGNGWLVDGFYLVDWNAKMYAANDDPEEDDYVRSGGTVEKDTSYEMVRLRNSIDSDDAVTVTIGGENYLLTEREMLFLGKIKWLLNRRHYHPDEPFWEFADRWADIEEEEPNLDKFDI